MPWYWIALLVCLVIGPFDALYLYIKAGRRRDELRRQRGEKGAADAPRAKTDEDRSLK